MILKIFLLSFFLLNIGFSQFQKPPWRVIANPVDNLLKSVQFINQDTGWAAGEGGTIIKTTDGGINWEVQNSNVESFIVDIFFLNENLGWALTIRQLVPFGTTILHTTNGGDDWIAEDFPQQSVIMNTIFFFDSLNGLIGGKNISKTTDGGQTWEVTNIDSSFVSGLPVYNFSFFSRDFGYACGGFIDLAGVIWKTTNGGSNWTAEGVSPDQVFCMSVIDSTHALCLSGDPEGFFGTGLITTTDAGISWSYEELPFFGLSFSIGFRTNLDAWSASGFQFIHSKNGGETWTVEPTPNQSVIYALDFVNNQTGYAVGDSGTVLKFVPPPVNVDVVSAEVTNFVLDQNYPNPFNPITKIKYSVPSVVSIGGRNLLVALKVYDVLGKEITTLVDEYKNPGDYEIDFDGSNLPGGIYFYQLKTGGYSQTKKMVLLK